MNYCTGQVLTIKEGILKGCHCIVLARLTPKQLAAARQFTGTFWPDDVGVYLVAVNTGFAPVDDGAGDDSRLVCYCDAWLDASK